LIFDSALAASLAQVAEVLHDAKEPWWIIGSVAVALHEVDPGEICDIDVLLGHNDALRYFSQLNLHNLALLGDGLFRSDIFGRWAEPPVEIEMMAGLKVKTAGGWQPVLIQSRETAAGGLYIPSRLELRSILISFGREKDLLRAAALN
jgi:hypothetical protein